MEDRHSVSEPRPVHSSDNDGSCVPSWEIDILRDGIIVDTFILNKDVLPPRTNKKGKVVWKLPEIGDKLPSFGTDDRRRILDIHKERKKKRKQDKKKVIFFSSQSSDEPKPTFEHSDYHNVSPDRKNVDDDRIGKAISEEYEQCTSDTNPLGGIENLSECLHSDYHDIVSVAPPPGLEISTEISDMRQLDQCDASEHTLPYSSPLGVPPDALFIVVPYVELLESPSGQLTSLAVPAARHFINTYYTHFDGTSPMDLSYYYTSEAQKSVSIGEAHSVVTGRTDITKQIYNFAQTSFNVRGVVAQDTVDKKGVHILVTGTARTRRIGTQEVGVVACFAHSVSLVRINYGASSEHSDLACTALRKAFAVGYPFQIHNDALALLGDVSSTSPMPSLQSTDPPLPPPGLF